MPVIAHIFADEADWLVDFSYRLAAVLPRNFNDARGNNVRLESSQGEWEGFVLPRIGATVIDPIVKRGYILHLNAIWRVTAEENIGLITEINLITGGEGEPGKKEHD